MALNVGELYAEVSIETEEFDKGVSGIKGSLGKLGGFVATSFAGLAAGAVAALGGALVGGAVAVNDFNKTMNGLQAATGATADEMASMGEQIKGIYSRNFGESFQEIGDAMIYAKQTTNAAGEELEYLTQDAFTLRDAFDMDVKDSIKGAGQMMKTFGTTGTDAMSMIAEAQQKGLNKADDLIDTIDEYSIYFKTAGLSAQDMFAVFENASKAGVRNLDFVGDAFKEMVIRTKDGSKTTVDAFQSLGLNAKTMGADFAAGGDRGRNAFTKMMSALNAIKDPVEKNRIGVELFGTKFEDLESKAVTAMGNLKGTITGGAEVLDSINKIKYDDFGSAMQGIGRQLMVGLIMPLGQQVLPYVNQFANWLSSKIPQLVEYFKGFGAAVGPAFAAFGPYVDAAIGVLNNLWTTLSTAFSAIGPMIQSVIPYLAPLRDTFITVFEGIWQVVTRVIGYIGPMIMSVIGGIISWWQTNGNELLTNFQIVWNGILAVINAVLPVIMVIVQSVFDNVKGVITGALDIISGLFKIFAGLITGDWSKLWEGVKQLLGGALEFLWNLFNLMMIGKLIGGFKTFITGGLNMFKTFGSKLGSTFSDFFNNIVNLFGYFKQTGASIWEAAVATFKNTISTFVSAAKANFKGVLDSATSIFQKVKTAIMNPVDAAKSAVSKAVQAIKGFFSGLSLKLPNIKTPHFKLKNWSPNPLNWVKAMPSISVDWFKTGGIATGPSIAGIGEAGSEAIVPLSGRRMKPFAEAIAKEQGGVGGGVIVNMYGDNYYSNDTDIEYVSKKIGDDVQRKLRTRGIK